MNAVQKNHDAVTLAEKAIRKGNLRLMRHAETRYMAGVFVSGETVLTDALPTAATDGWNKFYNPAFMASLPQSDVNGVILHENLHVFLKHIPRHKGYLQGKDARLANAAMDYVINAMIKNLQDKTLATLPDFCLYDPKFDGWSYYEVFEFLKTGRTPPPPQGNGGQQGASGGGGQCEGTPQDAPDGSGDVIIGKGRYRTKTQDEHIPGDGDDENAGDEGGAGEDDSQTKVNPNKPGNLPSVPRPSDKEIEDKVNDAILKGGVLAGALGQDLPRAVKQALEDRKVDWRAALADFLTSQKKGDADLTMRYYRPRYLADDMYMPVAYTEKAGDFIVAIDTSGSINDKQLAEFTGYLSSLCSSLAPDTVRVLWWGSHVVGEQVFTEGQYGALASLIKPVGGGGTSASSVSEYIVQKKLSADAVLVFTDGYVEAQIKWQVKAPTLWLVRGNNTFAPPAGTKAIKFED